MQARKRLLFATILGQLDFLCSSLAFVYNPLRNFSVEKREQFHPPGISGGLGISSLDKRTKICHPSCLVVLLSALWKREAPSSVSGPFWPCLDKGPGGLFLLHFGRQLPGFPLKRGEGGSLKGVGGMQGWGWPWREKKQTQGLFLTFHCHRQRLSFPSVKTWQC